MVHRITDLYIWSLEETIGYFGYLKGQDLERVYSVLNTVTARMAQRWFSKQLNHHYAKKILHNDWWWGPNLVIGAAASFVSMGSYFSFVMEKADHSMMVEPDLVGFLEFAALSISAILVMFSVGGAIYFLNVKATEGIAGLQRKFRDFKTVSSRCRELLSSSGDIIFPPSTK
jgi:hypothetical protein